MPASTIGANPITLADTNALEVDTALAQEIVFRASRENAADEIIYVGDSTVEAAKGGAGVMFDLGPGESVAIDVSSFSNLYVRGPVGATIYVNVLT